MRVYLCEKPSQARDIAAVVGAGTRADGYLQGNASAVTWCIGHLLELAPPETYDPGLARWSIEALPILPSRWQLLPRGKAASQIRVIRSLLKQATEVILATDADREGELIGREVLDECGWKGPLQRLWLSALDPASIRKALAQLRPGAQTQPLYEAALARSRADWLVGMNLTRLFTLLGRGQGIEGVLTVGRVQTPTLRLVVERDRAIEAFRPSDYWDVRAQFDAAGVGVSAQWQPPDAACDDERRCRDQAVAQQVARIVQGATARVAERKTERKQEAPPLPYDLSSLQQEASRRWGFATQKTLDLVQSLYERHKATTYPRTDCRYLPASQFAEVSGVVQALGKIPEFTQMVRGADLQIRSRAWDDGRITAHHAIIPTATSIQFDNLDESERQIYELVCRRYLAQFYPDLVTDLTRLVINCRDHAFLTRGRTVIAPGWTQVYTEPTADEDDPDPEIPKALPDQLHCSGAEVLARQTKPPRRYTEGTLLAAMKGVGRAVADPRMKSILKDTSGIGTEATRAAIIGTLQKRDLVTTSGRGRAQYLVSSPIGRRLIDALPKEVQDPVMTALWEQALEEIAAGRGTLDTFVERQASWVSSVVRQYTADGQNQAFSSRPADDAVVQGKTCPKCGKAMHRRKGPRGDFWGCSGYPDCRHTEASQRTPSEGRRSNKRASRPSTTQGSNRR